jgi:quercetin dioxygenase-like cupin family protein
MIVIRHDEQPWEQWRPGVVSRAWATAATGAQQVRIAEQIFDPGMEAPTHWHYFEENITVLRGQAEFWVDGELRVVEPGTTVVVLATKRHGFRNIGDEPLHILASMSWPINEMIYEEDEPGEAWRAGELLDGGARRKIGTVRTAVPR